jgi:hypothetical protein
VDLGISHRGLWPMPQQELARARSRSRLQSQGVTDSSRRIEKYFGPNRELKNWKLCCRFMLKFEARDSEFKYEDLKFSNQTFELKTKIWELLKN